jgi:phosphate transport system substrate-binding protein
MANNRLKYIAVVLVAIIAVSVAVVALTQKPSTPDSDENLSGKLTISGAFALYPMVVEWTEKFHELHPSVTFDVSAGGAGKGMTDALSGLSDLGMISRTITQTEIDNGAYYVAVTRNAALATFNADNPVIDDIYEKGITRQTFYNIFIAGNVTTWGEVVGRPEVTDKINVYARSDSAGVADSFAKYIGNKTQSALLGIAVNTDPGLAQAVIADRLGIGYNNIAYAYDANTGKELDGLRVVPIDVNENGVLDPDEKFYDTRRALGNAIAEAKFPLQAVPDLYLATKDSFSPLAKAFVEWVLTDGQEYVEPAGFVPLTNDVLNQQIQKLK